MIYVRRLRVTEGVLLLAAYVLAWALVDSAHYWHTAASNIWTASFQPKPALTVNKNSILHETNAFRTKSKVPPLAASPALAIASDAKCADMAKQKYFGQKDPKGADSWVFVTKAGAQYKQAGNVMSEGWLQAKTIERAWQKDTNAKAVLLSPAYAQTGVAVCHGSVQKGKPPQTLVVEYFSN